MTRVIVAASLTGFAGMTLILSEFRWFRKRSLFARLAPYVPGPRVRSPTEVLSIESFRELLRPLSQMIGGAMARLFGVNEELPRRLRRVHWDIDAAEFRLRQFGWAVAATVAAVAISITLGLPGPMVALSIVVAPAVAFLVVEQRLAAASDAWKLRVFRELPVIAEQIAMLLGSGYSLGAALARVAERGSGAVATDLTRVVARIRQGMSEMDALTEWVELVDVDAARRLVSVLSLNREAGDLGSMVAAEARTTRADAHRMLLEAIERKNQQVWIPVTLATLVPGAVLMAIPFFDALRSFGSQ